MKILLSFIIALTIVACSSKEEKIEKHSDDYNDSLRVARLIEGLTNKYPGIENWDQDASGRYSINYYSSIHSGYKLITDYIVTDIYTDDSLVYASIRTRSYPGFFFDFLINKKQEEAISQRGKHPILVQVENPPP